MKEKLWKIYFVVGPILLYSVLVAMIPGASMILSNIFAEIGDKLSSFQYSNPYVFYGIVLVVGILIYQYRKEKIQN